MLSSIIFQYKKGDLELSDMAWHIEYKSAVYAVFTSTQPLHIYPYTYVIIMVINYLHFNKDNSLSTLVRVMLFS